VIVGALLWSDVKTNFQLPANIEKNVHFTGHLASEKLVDVMASASCFVYVPYFEGFGIPLVEAMKCGVPIISGNLTSLPEVVGDAALLVNPFSVSEISFAMEKLYLDEKLRLELSVKGLERCKLFSWDQAAKSVWEIISSI
jgi:glycosyltransferase involved in cell wall biosynthesis